MASSSQLEVVITPYSIAGICYWLDFADLLVTEAAVSSYYDSHVVPRWPRFPACLPFL